MERARMAAPTLPQGITSVRIIEKEWGIERVYKSRDVLEHSIPESLLFSNDAGLS